MTKRHQVTERPLLVWSLEHADEARRERYKWLCRYWSVADVGYNQKLVETANELFGVSDGPLPSLSLSDGDDNYAADEWAYGIPSWAA